MQRIPLTQGKYAIVDDADYDAMSKYKWYARRGRNTWYATRRASKRVQIHMHREIMKASKDKFVDHCNGNGLDNRKENLRLCTNSQNIQNSRSHANKVSKYKGVGWHKQMCKWRAYMTKDGKYIHLGLFDEEKKAAIAYDKKAIELFGEFAYLNFPKSEKSIAS